MYVDRTYQWSIATFLVLLTVALAVFAGGFFSVDNVSDLATTVAMTAIVGCGALLVIATGNIDVSAGPIYAIAGFAAATGAKAGLSPVVCLALGIGVGAALGLVNGVLVAVLQLPSIIATLGTSSLFSGALVLGTGGANWVTDLPAAFTSLGQGGWGPISVPVLFAVVILPLVWLLSTQTSAGRRVMAVGSNSEAARLVGIRVKLVEGATFVLNGIFLGIGATLAVAYLGQAQTNLGAGITFTALTVAVVGGTDVFGGTGSVLGVTLAAVLIEMTDSALVFFHIDSLWAKALQGLFILMALAMSVAQHRRSRRPLRLPWVRGRKAADHA